MTTARPTSLLSIVAFGGLSALLYLGMAFVSRDYGDATLGFAGLTYGGAGLLSIAAACYLSREMAQEIARDAEIVAPRALLTWILGFALLFRVLGVLTFPVLEDDMYRYLWDGRMYVELGSPYGVPPAEVADESLNDRFADIADRINFPGVATVYGPVLQLMFALGYLLAPGELWPLQTMMAVADIALVFALAVLIQRGAPVQHPNQRLWQWFCWVLLAWSPLLVKEFSTTAHPDIVGALCVVLALAARKSGRFWLVGLLLALAAGVKPFALVIAPFLIGFERRAIVGFGLTVVGLTLPFLLMVPGSLGYAVLAVWLPEGLRAMGSSWLFNAGIYELGLRLGLTDIGLMRTVALAAFAALWSWQLWRQTFGAATREPEQILLWLFGLFLLVLPALNPWYLVWWLPFAVLRPAATPWVASFAVFASYVSGINLGPELGPELELYEIPSSVLLVEFGLIGLALLFDGWCYERLLARSSL